MIKKILLALLAILVIMQFFGIDKTNPPVDPTQDFLQSRAVSGEMASLIRTACYDCHSNTTKYPWYTSVAPVSWWIRGHIDHARENVNFSEFGTYKKEDHAPILRECAEVLEEKEMPMLAYMMLHRDAWINDEERTRMANFFQTMSTRGNDLNDEGDDEGDEEGDEEDDD